MSCAICEATIWSSGWIQVGERFICQPCADAVADALIREDATYYEGIRRDKRRFNRVRRKLPA